MTPISHIALVNIWSLLIFNITHTRLTYCASGSSACEIKSSLPAYVFDRPSAASGLRLVWDIGADL